MRRILFTLLMALISFGAWAQSAKNVLEIDPSSFSPIQTDALSGVAIDKIALDRSKRPCARIKMHVNRMTREEIDQISVRPIGGMVELTKKSTAIEGNGIIFEITAKEQVRFYLHHDKYGDSNEVSVNLEGHKEYRLEAQLNLLLPITVASNVKGADVYLDDAYKGRTGDDYLCAIADVTPGEHKIKIQHGAAMVERTVDVNSENFSFRMEVSTKSQAQFVVFEVVPHNALVMIDNVPHIAHDGYAQVTLQNGTYSWRVMAEGYHEQKGEFTVSGEKVTRQVTLVPDVIQVTITSSEGAEIWVNNVKKGLSPWSGTLSSGTYRFEARKENCRSVTVSHTLTSEQPEQSFTLDAPIPMMGTLSLSSTPPMADIMIDGKSVGKTPMLIELMVGTYRVSLDKAGYEFWTESISIEEGDSKVKTVRLTKLASHEPATVTPPPSRPRAEGSAQAQARA